MSNKFITDFEGKLYLMIPLKTKSDLKKAVGESKRLIKDIKTAIYLVENKYRLNRLYKTLVKNLKSVSKRLELIQGELWK